MNAELKKAVDKAVKRWNAMTPEEKAEMYKAQHQSWMRGKYTQ